MIRFDVSTTKDMSVQNAGAKTTVHQNIINHSSRPSAVTVVESCTLVDGFVRETGVSDNKVIAGTEVKQLFTILITLIWTMIIND